MGFQLRSETTAELFYWRAPKSGIQTDAARRETGNCKKNHLMNPPDDSGRKGGCSYDRTIKGKSKPLAA